MPVIFAFTHQTRAVRASQTTEHDPNDLVRGGLRTSIILNERGRSRVLFPWREKRGGGVAERRPRERENEIASHAYEVDGRSDIKVVPSVRRGATTNKWAEMFAKVAGSAWQIIFHPCCTSRRAGERGRKNEVYRCGEPCLAAKGKSVKNLSCDTRRKDRSMRSKILPQFIWRI